MDDGKLRALLTAVECGSFSKAAARLGYTQSAMTHLVNKLEAEVGCTLLERDSQGIRLTDAGRHLLPYIQNVVCACDTLLQEAAEQGLLKPGYPPDHYGEVVVMIMKGIAFDWCLSGAAFDMHERLDEIMVPYLKSIQTAPPETTGA